MNEVELHSETNRIARRGSVVLRNAGPQSPAVHSLLRYLEQRGFDGASRVVGSGFSEDGRETLSFIEGEQLDPRVPSEAEAAAIGARLRELHDLTGSFVMEADAVWGPWFGRSLGHPRLVGHCDAAPWNVIFTGDSECVFIDWECAGPVDPLVDLAQAAWLNARLFSNDIAEREGLPSLAVRAAVFRSLVDGYGLSRQERGGFLDLVIEFAVHSVANEADDGDVRPDTERSNALWGMAWRARSAAWMLTNRSVLDDALIQRRT